MPGVKVTGEPKKSKSGLQWFDIVEGKGVMPPDNKTTVEVHYTGWLIDGTKFDSSVDRGKSISFPLNRVIKGWTEGVGSMKVGGKRKLVIPPHLGYGSKGAGEVIPPNATLIFDVELISISCNQVPTQEEVDRLKKKAEMYKTDTLVFKGFYLGMPIQDAAALLRYYTKSKDIKVENGMLAITTNVQGFSSAFECVYADDNGNVITFYFTEDLIKQIWNLNDMPRLEFLQRFMKNYSIPELTPTQVTWTGLRDGLSADIGIQTKYSYRSAKGFEVNFFEVMQGYDTRTVLGNDLLQNREKSGCGRDKSMLVKMIQTESERTSNFD